MAAESGTAAEPPRRSSPRRGAVLERFSLRGRVAVVTGGNSGIGLAIAGALADAGAAVVLVARREAELEGAARALRAGGARCAWRRADLSDGRQLAGCASVVGEPFGAPDILVNAAGVNIRRPMLDLTDEDWDATVAVNLRAPFQFARALVPAMIERGWGRVINVTSLQSVRAFGNSGAYGASKGGLAQLTRAQAEAFSRHGVNCNAIAPGVFPTALTAAVFADPKRARALAERTLIGRNGELADVEGAAVFLASPASDYITGQTLFVDGGFCAG